MKVGTYDEINEKDAAISYDHFLLNIFGGQFRQLSRYLGFPEGSLKLFIAHSLPFFLDFCSCVEKRKDKLTKVSF